MSKSTSKNFGDAKIFLAGREQHLIIGKPSFNNIRTLMVSVFLLMATFFISAQNNNDFDDGLTKSILFYDAQICGKQPSWVRFDWRFNCHMNDGKDVNRDLTGGYHDAGDHTKFNYITAHAMRVLAWSLIDYRGSFNNTGNEQHLLRHLRWGADYMIKMHPSKNEYYSQIGVAKASPNPEHGEWVPAHRQSPNIDRSAKKITTKNPGTHMAAATAGALAATAIVFKNRDSQYSNKLLRHARELYDFADKHRGYHDDLTPNFRGSIEPYPLRKKNDEVTDNNYQDDLFTNAVWLWRATGEQKYKSKAESEFNHPSVKNAKGWMMHYRDHAYEGFLLMSKLTGEAKYFNAAEVWLDGELDAPRTNGGLYFRSNFLAASLGASMAYGALYYAELRGTSFSKYNRYRRFAFDQVDYIFGDNKLKMSYIPGIGTKFPRRVHHRTASNTDRIIEKRNDTYELTGALVGGPSDPNDNFDNDRGNVKTTEPSINNQAFFVGLMAQMVKESDGGTQPPSGKDEIVSITAPGQVTQGKTAQLTVKYSAKTNRDIGVLFRRDGNPNYQKFNEVKLAVAKGSRTATINVPIPSNVPVKNNDYQFQVYIVPKGGSFSNRLSSKVRNDVNVLRGQSTPPGNGTIRIRAKGDCGSERMQLRVNNVVKKIWNTVRTNYTVYEYNGFSSGRVSIHFVNAARTNGCDRNLEVDWIEVCGKRLQTETKATETSSCCKGDRDKLYTNGNFNFGNQTCGSSPSGNIVIRAKGDCGDEVMELYVNGAQKKRFTGISNGGFADYVYSGYSGGRIVVRFVNDGSGSCSDRNLTIDYITVCGRRLQTETEAVEENSTCCLGNKEKLFTNGQFNFGNRSCSVALKTKLIGTEEEKATLAAFPNPVTDGMLHVSAKNGFSVEIYDLLGREVLTDTRNTGGDHRIFVKTIPSGIYLLRLTDAVTLKSYTSKLSIR